MFRIASVLLVFIVVGCVAYSERPNAAQAAIKDVRTIVVGGLKRNYCLYVPRSYKPGNAVVFHFHGGGGNCKKDRLIGGTWQKKADKTGFIVVRPSGWKKTWNACSLPPNICRTPEGAAEEANVNDLEFFDVLSKVIDAEFSTGKIYVGGHSLGGMLSYYLACHRPGVIAAASGMGTSLRSQSCAEQSIPFLHMHGRDDWRVPWPAGGKSDLLPGNENPWPSPLNGIRTRARLNGCSPDVETQQISEAAQRSSFKGCKADTEYWVVDCEHGWPGKNKAWMFWANCTKSFRAEDVFWDFYKRH